MPFRDPERQREAQHASYLRTKERNRERARRRYRGRRDWLDDLIAGHHCAACPEDDPTCFDFHHVNPAEKEIKICDIVRNGTAWKRMITELEKCIILCANCHRKFHAGRIELDVSKTVKVGVEMVERLKTIR